MSEWIDVVPAYGADYKTQKEVREAWKQNKDFQIVSYDPHCGQYINASDHKMYNPAAHIMVRYNKQQKVMEVK